MKSRKEIAGHRFNTPCLIGVDYDEGKPKTYRQVQIETPGGLQQFGSGGDFDADLKDALYWFACEQPTQVLHWRSSVLHFFQDRRAAERGAR